MNYTALGPDIYTAHENQSKIYKFILKAVENTTSSLFIFLLFPRSVEKTRCLVEELLIPRIHLYIDCCQALFLDLQ